jgi:iron-sulfur cluster repair protein YtfE (RIC family)
VAGAQLAPISAAGDVIETHPQSAELVRRGATAYGTGGMSEVAQGLDLKSIINKNEIKDEIKDIKQEVKEEVKDVKQEVEEVADGVKEA